MHDQPEDWEGWRGLKTRTLAEFLTRYPHPFLLQSPTRVSKKADFETIAGPGEEVVGTTDVEMQKTVLYAVAKTPRNPFADRVFVGRATNCDIHLKDISVSKLHAWIRVTSPSEMEISDTRSVNGTMVNGVKLRPESPVRARSGDTLTFGFVVLQVVSPEELYQLL